jgi:hypothetical protein
MVILLASFHEFTLFLKIVLWIAIPLITVSFIVTTILHYRQKKKNALLAEQHPELPLTGPVDISLVSRLQREVLFYRKKIKELQHALTFAKAAAPVDNVKAPFVAPIIEAGSLKDAELILPATPEMASTIHTDASIQQPVTGLAEPNTQSTTESILFEAGSPAESAYLHDLVTEQKSHIGFLQQQLESRIKAFHDLEFQFRENAETLEKMTVAYEHVRHQLDDQEAAASMARIEKDNLHSKIHRLELSLRELQDQHTQSLKMLDHASTIPAIELSKQS